MPCTDAEYKKMDQRTRYLTSCILLKGLPLATRDIRSLTDQETQEGKVGMRALTCVEKQKKQILVSKLLTIPELEAKRLELSNLGDRMTTRRAELKASHQKKKDKKKAKKDKKKAKKAKKSKSSSDSSSSADEDADEVFWPVDRNLIFVEKHEFWGSVF